MSFAQWDRDSRDFAAFLVEEANCRPGDRVAIMLPNMLAYPVTFLGALARRHDGGQRQPALYAARIATAARRFRRRRHRHHGEFRPQAAGNHRRHGNPPRRGGPARRFRADAQALGVQLREFLYRARRAGLALRDIHHAAGRLRSGAERALPGRAGAGQRRRVAAIYRRHHRGRQGRHADSSQSDRQYAAVLRLERRRRAAGSRARAHAAAALSHLLADGEPAELCGSWRAQLPHSRSARPAPSYPHHAPRQDYLDVRRQYAVQCARQRARIRRIGFRRVAGGDGRRRRGAKRGGAALARNHRQRIGRRLRPDRSFAGGLHQSVFRSEARHRRPAGALDRSQHSRRCRQGGSRSAKPARSGCAGPR